MSQTRTSTRLVAEFVIIVVSILAAFAVEEFRDERARRDLRTTALANIRAEIKHNLEALEGVMPYHAEVASGMGPFLSDPANWRGRSGFEVGAVVAPSGVLPPDLRHTAWETTRSTGALALFDYEVAQRIAQVYDGQEQGVSATIGRLVDHVFTSAMFRPEEAEAALFLLGAMASELYAQEHQLASSLRALLDTFPE